MDTSWKNWLHFLKPQSYEKWRLTEWISACQSGVPSPLTACLQELGKPISQLFPLQCCFMIYVLWSCSFLDHFGTSLHISHEITEYLVHCLVTIFMHKVLSLGNKGILKWGHTHSKDQKQNAVVLKGKNISYHHQSLVSFASALYEIYFPSLILIFLNSSLHNKVNCE